MSSIMPWMVDMLEYMKTILISRMNEDAASKERLEELVTIAQADNTKLRLGIEENTIALVKSLVGDATMHPMGMRIGTGSCKCAHNSLPIKY